MASAAVHGVNLAELVDSVPNATVAARDPYASFRQEPDMPSESLAPAGSGQHWRMALDAQPRFVEEGFAQTPPQRDKAFDRLFGTNLGRAAVQVVGNESKTLRQVAGVAADALAAAMTLIPRKGHGPRHFWAEEQTRTLVVPGNPESEQPPTLLLLDPDADSTAERVTDRVALMAGPLLEARARLRDGAPAGRDASAVEDMIFGTGPDALLTALWIVRPEVILVRKPKMVPLSCPSPAVEVRAGAERSSMGMFCRDADGKAGFTACFHGTGPVGTAITLGGLATAVTLANPVQDLIFAPLPDGYVVPNFAQGIAGIRRLRAPAQNDPAMFDGCTSGASHTVVTSHDAGLLRTRATVQLKVQTTAALNRGDSGSALIDENEQVMAFAFERTAIDEPIQFADWIWAANAFDALALQPL